MAQKNYRFETLQLHVGQEQADPATDARAVPIYRLTPLPTLVRCPSIRPPLTCSVTHSTQPTASASAMQVISMVD